MLLVQFNKPATIAGGTYGVGQHQLPPEAKQDWYFDALLKDGDIVVLRDCNPPEVDNEGVAQGVLDFDKDKEPDSEEGEEYSGVLDSGLKELKLLVPELELDDLEKLLADEKAGKTRKSVMALIEGEIKERA